MFFFNWEYYVNKYPDLANYQIDNKEKAINHWIKYGKKEKRICSDIPIFFGWKFYLLNNNDLVDSGIDNEYDAWRHYVYHGFLEGRYHSIENLIKIYCLQYQ